MSYLILFVLTCGATLAQLGTALNRVSKRTFKESLCVILVTVSSPSWSVFFWENIINNVRVRFAALTRIMQPSIMLGLQPAVSACIVLQRIAQGFRITKVSVTLHIGF